MSDAILVLNAGSSSVKFSLFPADQQPERGDLICEGACAGIGHRIHFSAKDSAGRLLIAEDLQGGATHEDALGSILRWLRSRLPQYVPAAAGHRIVHGGSTYSEPVLRSRCRVAGIRSTRATASTASSRGDCCARQAAPRPARSDVSIRRFTTCSHTSRPSSRFRVR